MCHLQIFPKYIAIIKAYWEVFLWAKRIFPVKSGNCASRPRYTQEEVSRRLNIQRQTYCNYENAARTPPIEIIVSLAELYHVSVDYLVRDTEMAPYLGIPEKKLLNEFSALSSSKQKEVIEFIQFKKHLPD